MFLVHGDPTRQVSAQAPPLPFASLASAFLSVALGNSLQFVLLLDGLVGETLGDGLDVAEGGFSGSGAQQPDGLVDATQRRDVDGLSADGSGAANSGGVLTGAAVDDRIDENLQRILSGQQVDDLEGVLDDAHRHQLLAVVAAVHHHRVGQALDDGALRLAEALLSVPSRGVGQVAGELLLHGDVVLVRGGNRTRS
ncbi:hypothetical protein TYRP_016499 [Tyrophagus putrescentiae]|nr:hypothetical protein TYRP_016499 [Tyrophagus putrescentiae]